MKKIFHILAVTLLCACAKEGEQQTEAVKVGLTFRVSDFKSEALVKSTVNTMLKSFWKQGDVIGIIPGDSESPQGNFIVKTSGAEVSTTSLDKTSWTFANGQRYVSYYPSNNTPITSSSDLSFSLEGQIQEGNNNTAHLGNYDLMYAESTMKVDEQTIFSFAHKCAVANFRLQVPAKKEFSHFCISADASIPSNLTISMSDGIVSLSEGKQQFHVSLKNVMSDSDGSLSIWAMIPPCDMSSATMVVTAQTKDGSVYSSDVIPMKKYVPGVAYTYNLSTVQSDLCMKIDNENVTLRSLWNYYVAHTTQQVPFDVVLSHSSSSIASADVSPHSKEIHPSIHADGLHFTINDYGYYLVTINGTKICLFADRDEETPQGVDIKTFKGTDATGQVEMTRVMQEAINSTASSGQTLILSKGQYLCRQLYFPSNTDIYIEKDAELVIDASDRNYYVYDSYWTFLHSENADNVKIRGLGIIDGRLRHFWSRYGDDTKVKMLIFRNCTNVLLEGVHFKDCSRWNIHLFECSDVECRRLKVYDNIDILGNDGIDPDCSQRVLIERCFIMTGDDCVPVKTHYIPDWCSGDKAIATNDVVVRDNVMLSGGASVMKTGLDIQANSSDIHFINNDVIEAGKWPIDISALRREDAEGKIMAPAGDLTAVYFEDNRIESCNMYLRIRLNAGLSDCNIRNCTYETVARRPSDSTAHGDRNFAASCMIENVNVAGSKITSNEDWSLDVSRVTMLYF